jgi:hypothetical protein
MRARPELHSWHELCAYYASAFFLLSACVVSKIDQHPVLGKSSFIAGGLKFLCFAAPMPAVAAAATTTSGNNESIYCCGINVVCCMSCADGEHEHAPRAKVINVFVISAATINTQVVKFASKSLSVVFCCLGCARRLLIGNRMFHLR